MSLRRGRQDGKLAFMATSEVQDIVSMVARSGLFVAAVFVLRYAARNYASESGRTVILWAARYIGYVVVGSGVGVLLSAYIIINSLFPLPNWLVLFVFASIGGLSGYWIATKYPDSVKW